MALTDDARAPLLSRNRIDETDNRSGHSNNDNEEINDYGSSNGGGGGVYRYPLYLQPGQFTSLEKLMFFISSILLIFLCVFIGLYARSSFDDRLQPPVIPDPSPIPSDPPVVQPAPPDKNQVIKYCIKK